MESVNNYLQSEALYLEMPGREVALFRFLLESYENVAVFTVLEKNPAIIKLSFAPGSYGLVSRMLDDLKRSVNLIILNYKF